MYTAVIFFHGLMRWLVLFSALHAVIRSWRGPGSEYTSAEAKAGLAFVIALDTQVLVGLLLYTGISPLVQVAMSNMGAAMKDATLRFFVVEHLTSMVIALAAVHVGRVRVRKANDGAVKRRRALVWNTVALVALVIGNPWPFLPYGRPLLPHL